ncbi:MAG: tyrosine-type recombinase/integrase [Solobacterium sp.]|jgi:integrase|nr:tyrosine-type recombinase/integrase [Solobacterium sp.]MCH4049334.1 tyrosine-type recombinase/integrase [Solobacterium sp.]MCH4075190.1 tyrosine-type recombinase/integrase [Solobacterium sp.]MCI1313335.1 tyrosine-type recombinase/integrase [Solobacterium sp.]MCI1345586.1 tyrosine-type recombinase/integrase [Solobacterium sp.]
MKKEKYIEERYKIRNKKTTNEITAFVVNIPMPDGKKYVKRYKVLDYKTANDAKKAAIRERDSVLNLIHQNKDATTPEDAVTAIQKRLVKNKVLVESTCTVDDLYQMVPANFPRRKGTYVKLDKEYRKYIYPDYGTIDIHNISSEDILQSLQNCADHCVQQCVGNVKTIWHRIYQVAMLKGLNVTDWTTIIDVPKSEKHTTREMSEQNVTEDEFESFLSYMECYGRHNEEWDYNRQIIIYMLRVMRLTGLRPQEVKALTRKSIEFKEIIYFDREAGEEKKVNAVFVTVTHSVGSTHSDLVVIRDTKTISAKRTIPLSEASGAVALFRSILDFSKYDVVFANYNGELISSDWLADHIYYVRKAYKRDTGRDIDMHATLMRKSYSADLYAQHENPAVIKQLMGHKHEDMSLNWYASAQQNDVINASFNRKFKEK